MDGQPIGKNASRFTTFVGRITKTHIPPAYPSWPDVPEALKEHVWNMLLAEWDVPLIYKHLVMSKANLSWKNRKYKLRRHCDEFQTEVERKRNLPSRLRKEDWENFVEYCSTKEDQARQQKGKDSREKMKTPHTSGRRGAARTAEELKKGSSSGTITRTQLYLAIHTKKDGTCPSPTSSQQIVCGPDGRGRIRGMGSGVSRTTIRASAPYKEASQREKKARESLESKVESLTKLFEEEFRARKSFEERMMASSNNVFGSTSQVRRHSPVLPESLVTPTSTRCLLKNMKGNIVALGRINRDAILYPDLYSVIVDDVYIGNTELYEGEGTFADITLDDTITWPKYFIQFI